MASPRSKDRAGDSPLYLIRFFIRCRWDGHKPRGWPLCRSSDRPSEGVSFWVRSTRDVLNLVHDLEAKGAALTVLEPAFSTKDASGDSDRDGTQVHPGAHQGRDRQSSGWGKDQERQAHRPPSHRW